ncbi:MAG TPA: hypothetical protein VI603_17740, partial [Saprospiraceae bacterium]|nr:hypothetical protein [Saprospiraceae bacterium]
LMMKPHQLFAFGLLVAFPLLLLLVWHPEKGFQVFEDVTLQFPTFRKIFFPPSDTVSTDTSDLFSDVRDPEVLKRKQDSLRAAPFQIHYPHGDPSFLYPLFDAIQSLQPGKRAVHILHFGGSQIEGDRITEDLRAKLQGRFGGKGPGWLPAVPYVGSRSFTIEYSDNWQRHALYGLIDTTVQHNHYGALGLYARFTDPADSISTDTTSQHAWIQYQSRYGADVNVKSFRRFTLFYGYHRHPVELTLMGGDQIIHQTTLQPSERTAVFQYALPQARREIKLEFTGKESPEVYGVSLEGSSGILVSNISLRGQSGTHFWTQPAHQLRTMFGTSNIKLIILQFGANVVPYTTTDTLIAEYCYRFGKNIEYLKKLIPGVSVIVIGPADMAMKQGTEWVSYPLLPRLRDVMKKTAFAAGSAYWDPYAAMGGAGTIMDWVSAQPPLAANDHVHFTVEGAEKIAQWFYDALIKDYEQYLEGNKKENDEETR